MSWPRAVDEWTSANTDQFSRRRALIVLSLLCVGAAVVPSRADEIPHDPPVSSYIYPAGAQRGTSVAVRIGGLNLHSRAAIRVVGSGISAGESRRLSDTLWFEGPVIHLPASKSAETYPKEFSSEWTISSDTSENRVWWQLWTSQGAVTSRPFVIGDLPEVVEQEQDGRPLPVAVKLPVTINGRIFPREDVDVWQFDCHTGQTVTCSVVAEQIGSTLDSRIEVRDSHGAPVAENEDHRTADSLVRFTAAHSGRYEARIHDTALSGHQSHVYRLTVTSGPKADTVFPLGGQRGTTVDFEVDGQDLKHPTHTVSLPNHADRSTMQLDSGPFISEPVTIALSDHREFVVGHLAPDTLVDATEPVVLNGRIHEPGHTDRWRIHAHPSTMISYRLVSSSLGSELDAVIQFIAADGTEISAGGSTLSHPVEPEGTLEVPADGLFSIAVRHVDDKRAGDNYAYRLQLDPVRKPDWNLQLTTDAVTVFRGRESSLGIVVTRRNGMQLPVRLELEGLPDGVDCDAVEVPGDQSCGTLTLRAAATASVEAVPVQIVGTIPEAADGEPAPPIRKRIAVMPRRAGAPERNRVLVAVAMPTPFRIVGDQYRIEYAARGTVHRRPFVIHRNGYTGPLTLRLADNQVRHLQGVTAAPMTVPADVSEVTFPVQIPPWLEMSRTGRIVVTAIGQVQDEHGRWHAVSNSTTSSDDQIIILTAPAPLGVVALPQALRLHAGQTSQLAVTVKRGQLLDRPVDVVLQLPAHMRGISAAPLLLTGDRISGQMEIKVAESFGPLNMDVRLRASTDDDNGDLVVADCAIELVGDRRRVTMIQP